MLLERKIYINKRTKQIVIYLFGLCLLAFGVNCSVIANLGVSPVSSLAYSITLITKLSLGATTFLANVLFIVIQIIISKKFEFVNYIVQLMITFVFSIFIDATMYLASFLPAASTFFDQFIYLFLSLMLIAFAIFLYLHSSMPMMPYDTLLPTISKRFGIKISKTKVICDVLTVTSALILSIIFLHSLGSIGIGTVVSALTIGRILGIFMSYFSKPLLNWINNKQTQYEKI